MGPFLGFAEINKPAYGADLSDGLIIWSVQDPQPELILGRFCALRLLRQHGAIHNLSMYRGGKGFPPDQDIQRRSYPGPGQIQYSAPQRYKKKSD